VAVALPRPRRLLALACLIGTAFAHAQSLGAAATARAPGENPEAAFVAQAERADLAAVALSRVARRAARSPRVRSLAAEVLRDRSADHRRLALIAAHENIDLPHALDADQAARRAGLSRLDGDALDDAYLRLLIANQRGRLALFESAGATVRPEELRTYIRTSLPQLRGELGAAQALRY